MIGFFCLLNSGRQSMVGPRGEETLEGPECGKSHLLATTETED